MSQCASSCCWQYMANSDNNSMRSNKKTLKATEEAKWMAIIILQCSLCLSDHPHPLHLNHSTFPPISPLSICTVSSSVSCRQFVSLSLPIFFSLSAFLHSYSFLSSYLTRPSLQLQHPSVLPQYVGWANGYCGVTPTGLTLSSLLTPFIQYPLLSPIITGMWTCLST